MSELTSLSGRLLEPEEGREVLSRLQAASRWNSVSAAVTLQEGSSSVATALLDLDREAQTWHVTAPETGETLARYRDGVMWTAEDGTVTPASFEEGPSPALGLLFPWRLPLWGRRDRGDDSAPLLVRGDPHAPVVVCAHHREIAMTSGMTIDPEHGIVTKLIRYATATILDIRQIA